MTFQYSYDVIQPTRTLRRVRRWLQIHTFSRPNTCLSVVARSNSAAVSTLHTVTHLLRPTAKTLCKMLGEFHVVLHVLSHALPFARLDKQRNVCTTDRLFR